MTARAREGIHTLLDPEGADDAPSDYPSAWEAFKALDDLCAAGELTMHGIEHGAGDSGPIPADAWAKLALVTIARWGLVAARRGSEVLDPDARWWNDLTIRSADVQRIWPPIEAKSERPPDNETTIKGWLEGEMVRRARVGEPKDRDTMVVALTIEFPELLQRRAKELFTALPKGLKAKRGPRPAP
jgi:hypothetical protein